MKRTCLLSTAAVLATLATSSVASATPKPAIVYIPVGDVDLTPSGTLDTHCQKVSMSADVAAAGCVGGLAEAGTRPAHGDAQATADAVTAALAAYDITVVTEAPPSYVPVYAVLTSPDMSEESTSHTCGGAALTCASRGRDSVAFTNTGTMNCADPDLVQSALYTIGRLAGLEGKEDAMDVMAYPPNYMMPVTDFVDACGAIAPFLGGDAGDMPLPLECTSADHEGDCESGEQNSHADMNAYFGAAIDDTTAPEIGIQGLEDGDVLPDGSAINATAKIEEDSDYVAVRITIASPALDGVDGIVGGELSFCTSDICDVNFLDNDPFKTADSEWTTGDINGLPGGEYTITLEASDYAGNEAETVSINITLEGGPVDPSGGSDTDGETDGTASATASATASETNASGFVTDGDESSGGDTDGSGSGAVEDGDGGGGCSVGTSGGAGGSFALMLGLLGLGFVRRRN